ncbi:hypothetical protein [Xylanimonas oleitrophica]|nr:hypothetical protein [Xylanimonas oleitrophica]
MSRYPDPEGREAFLAALEYGVSPLVPRDRPPVRPAATQTSTTQSTGGAA